MLGIYQSRVRSITRWPITRGRFVPLVMSDATNQDTYLVASPIRNINYLTALKSVYEVG